MSFAKASRMVPRRLSATVTIERVNAASEGSRPEIREIAALYLAATLGGLALVRERGLVNRSGLIRLAAITAPAILVTALVAGRNGLPTVPLVSLTPVKNSLSPPSGGFWR